ncbi:hypothetical protein ILP92_18150, partial [Maribius pontilimi]|nr:hypothetical protein [Palleronia pontilimi]
MALIAFALFCAASIGVLRMVYALPQRDDSPSTRAIPISAETTLGARVETLMVGHPDLDGIQPLADGRDAFAARILMVTFSPVSGPLRTG